MPGQTDMTHACQYLWVFRLHKIVQSGHQGTRLGNKRSNGINSKSSKAMVHFAAFSQALMLASVHRLHRLHPVTAESLLLKKNAHLC